ncbi:MAG TPA: hypothetical protein VD926_01555 [Acidimicrobiales bacterium]|nr:hypothetical protein [Acidimicrobiales bacterium]
MVEHGTDLTRGDSAGEGAATPSEAEDADLETPGAADEPADAGIDDDPSAFDDDEPVSDRTTLAIGVIMAIVAIAIIGVLVATGGGDDGGGGGAETRDAEGIRPTTAVFGTLDEFDRRDARQLGAFTTDRDWDPVVGRWGVDNGDAYVVDADEFRNHAVIGLGQSDGAVQVRLDQLTAGAGLVFRFRGPGNYWAVVAAPNGGTWNLIRVEDTAADVVGNTGITPVVDGTTVAARFVGEEIEVIVNGVVHLTAQDDFLSGEGKVGITVRGDDATEARFDDFVAALPGNRPLFVGEGRGAPPTTDGG